jgi:hypothetical protein
MEEEDRGRLRDDNNSVGTNHQKRDFSSKAMDFNNSIFEFCIQTSKVWHIPELNLTCTSTSTMKKKLV